MLGEHNLDEVTRTIHTQFPLLFQRATGEPGIRNYLTWFTGLTVEVGLTCSGEHQDPNPTTSRTDEPGPDAREVASGTPLLWADDDRLAAEGSGALETAPRGAARRELRR
jgi:hypothetical protein